MSQRKEGWPGVAEFEESDMTLLSDCAELLAVTAPLYYFPVRRTICQQLDIEQGDTSYEGAETESQDLHALSALST